MKKLMSEHYALMARQLVDSNLASTREFWRIKIGCTESEALDPRPFNDVIYERPLKGLE